ncbi:hypothetical protein CH267_01960 [Rhodococcus sp. 06-621-2]|nr:hypothetical protein [Rhodococcus sp. 06-621-2]OZC62323.1 hypothetical protein CH267_01960 [Rhodococcus sp. 06-621-2]
MTRWHPWRHLRDTHPHVDVHYVDLSHLGLLGRVTDRGIEIEQTASQRERRDTLTHELQHVERGMPSEHPYYSQIEERLVEKLTAEKLIDLDDLVDALVWNRCRVDGEMAEDLWVRFESLALRVKHLTDAERAYIDAELERRA